MIRAVLFDLDGVLVDTFEVWFAVQNEIAAANGYPEISHQQMKAAWGQGVDEDTRTFFPGMTVSDLEMLLDEAFPRHLGKLETLSGALEVLAGLAAREVPFCIVTNTPAPLARVILTAAGLEARELVGGTDVGHPKPAPDMVLEACRRLGVDPVEAMMIGDSDYDQDAARAAGCGFIGFRRDGETRIDALEELPAVLAERLG
ncbi:MAG: HAD family hydrolase [Acidobacteriota bacterium]|nr:HAD family hydrolase [Acidobacteriota bacterium]